MPLDRFVLIVIAALAAAGVTVLLAAIGLSAGHLPGLGLGIGLLAALAASVLARVIWDRWRSGTDDRYDRLRK